MKRFELINALDARALIICFNTFGIGQHVPIKPWFKDLPEVIKNYDQYTVFPEEYLDVFKYLNNKMSFMEDEFSFGHSKEEARKSAIDSMMNTLDVLLSIDNLNRISIGELCYGIIPDKSPLYPSFKEVKTVENLSSTDLWTTFDDFYEEQFSHVSICF